MGLTMNPCSAPDAPAELQHLARGWSALRRACGGNVALIVALAIPAAATLVFGAVDVTSILSDRERMRSIAEAAALAGARNLSVAMSETDAAEHARAMADAVIAEWPNGPALKVDTQIVRLPGNAKAVRVELDARRASFFGDLLPPGGWTYSADATASSVGMKPLCVLSFGDGVGARDLQVRGSAEIRGPQCLVHSNGDVDVKGGRIEAGQTEAVRTATGDISPDPITDAPRVEDPFTDLPLPNSGLPCLGKGRLLDLMVVTTGVHTLPPGDHCGVVTVGGDAILRLAPGEHNFRLGLFTVGGGARLIGEDVVLTFDLTSTFLFTGNSMVDISGRQSGKYAGFVVMAARGNTKAFDIDSTHVERLDGVIYIPDAQLRVSGKSDVARQSDWTVIVADRLSLSGNPRLYLNADYNGADVGVPAGVGPRRDGVRLID